MAPQLVAGIRVGSKAGPVSAAVVNERLALPRSWRLLACVPRWPLCWSSNPRDLLRGFSRRRLSMDTTTLLIIVIVLIVLGGGGVVRQGTLFLGRSGGISPLGVSRQTPRSIDPDVGNDPHGSGDRGRLAGAGAGGDAAALRSEGHFPWRSFRSRAAGHSLCGSRDRFAIRVRRYSQAAAAADLAHLGALAFASDARGAFAHPCLVRNDRRPGYGHFRPGRHLGGQASGRHSPASGAIELSARPYRYAATVSAAG